MKYGPCICMAPLGPSFMLHDNPVMLYNALKRIDHRKDPPNLIEQSVPDCSIRVTKFIDFSVDKQGFIAW